MTSHWLGHWTKDKDNIYDLNTSLVLSDPANFKFMLDKGVTFTLQTNSNSTLTLDCGQSETKIIWNGNVVLNEGALDLSTLYTTPPQTKGSSLILSDSDEAGSFFSSAIFNFSGILFCAGPSGSNDIPTVLTFTANSITNIDVDMLTLVNAKVMLDSHAFIWITTDTLSPPLNATYYVSDNAALHTIFKRMGNSEPNYATSGGYTLGGEVPSGQNAIQPFIHLACTNTDTDKDWFDDLPPGFFNFTTIANDGRPITNNGMFMFSLEGGYDAVQKAANKMESLHLFSVDGKTSLLPGGKWYKFQVRERSFLVTLRN